MAERTHIIYCAGNQGRVVLDILRRVGLTDNLVFVDDVREPGTKIDTVEVVGGHELLEQYDPEIDRCIVAIGGQQSARRELVNRVESYGFDFFSAVDPNSTVSSTASIGRGVMLNARTYIGPGATIESHTLIDSCVNVSHDATVSAGATIAPNATLAGGVTIEPDAFIGAGAVVVDEISVGERAIVGAGAVVTDDVPNDTTVVGVPARKMSK